MSPSYSETWDVTVPAGSRNRALGDDDIRAMKRAFDERLNEDHFKPSDETGETRVGYHRKVTLPAVANPTPVADAIVIFGKDFSNVTEACLMDENGNVIQLTSGGAPLGLGTDKWRTGDKILSSNVTTPTGWTDISTTYSNYFIRISSGTPLTTGGTDSHSHGATTGAHILTVSELPNLNFSLPARNANGWDLAANFVQGSNDSGGSGTITGSTSNGGAGSHSHTVATDSNIPVYVQMKMYSKN